MSPEMRQALFDINTHGDFSMFNQAEEIITLRQARIGKLRPVGVAHPECYGIERFIYNGPLSTDGSGKVIGIEWNIHCDHCASGTRLIDGEVYACEECGGDGWQLAETLTTDLHGNALELDL